MKDHLQIPKGFCVLPWLHLHVMPDSSVIPCCVSPYDDHYGNVSKEAVEDIWNNPKYRELRLKMLKGELSPGCHHCHALEDAGFSSMRTSMNERFKEHVPKFLQDTQENGTFHDLKLRYIDIRFSNLCNFKCRGCGPSLSSSWQEDHHKLFNYDSQRPKVVSVSVDSPDFWRRFQELVMDAEEIYFGGGEPLITKEHFDLLRLLIDKGRTNLTLAYNTNLSTLTYGKHDLAHLWGQFERVSLGISIDDQGERGEYFRHGTKWNLIVENMRKLRDDYAGIGRYVNCTVSLFNVYYLPELFEFLVGERIITENDFNINLLLDPFEYRIDSLPAKAKFAIRLKLEEFVVRLEGKVQKKAAADFKKIIAHMMNNDQGQWHETFKERTRKLDEIRGENFSRTYPELARFIGHV